MSSNGTRVNDDGRVRINSVLATYVPIGTDEYINGTLHDSVGNMYITVGVNVGATDVLINGIRHTANGVRYTDDSAKAITWPEGFSVDSDGRQGTTVVVENLLIRGIARSSDGRMAIQAA